MEMIQFRDRLYLEIPNVGIMEWDGTAGVRMVADPKTVPMSINWAATASLAVHNDRLYSFGTLDVPGIPDTLRRTCAAYDGSSWHPVSSVREFGWPIEYKETLYAHGLIRSSCGTQMNNLAMYCDDGMCSQIVGTIYRDDNDNCQQDSGEQGIAGRIVELNPGPLYVTTDAAGTYRRYVGPGTYSVAPAPYLHWSRECSENLPRVVTIGTTIETSSGNDLAAAPIPGIRDMRVSVAGGLIRPGRATTFVIHYINVGTEPVSGTVRFTYDATLLTYESSTPPAAIQTPGLAEWITPTLEPGEEGTIIVTMTAATTAGAGREICVAVDCFVGDVFEEMHDNHDEACITVIASYDPNDISVMPPNSKNGFLLIGDTVLSYQIRFQNTGNDTAFNVVIRDTLDRALDIPTLAFGAASHPYTWHLEGTNILVITFKEIMLPDSNVNEKESHGIIKYRVHLKQNLAPRTEIPNRVGIYFDYNSVVMTNQVVSRTPRSSATPVDPTLSSMVRSYPRPVRDLLYIDGRLVAGSAMMLRSIDGAIISSTTATGNGREQIPVAGLATGAYLLELNTVAGWVVERVIVTR